ncbi:MULTISPECIES: ATP synthase subunit I [Paenibacillus]|uniref:ATP synthase subunit I n=1 Tax=Paenibacillus TaxID=44249 RepID=UPI0008AC8C86|nr:MULTISPECIES: ATP synthase subunit I [Paenibacillus]QLG38155.1 ATP synthase subunit I [Paenibacillus sp. E222]QOS81454.1 ATP synthase subunit I [Paenibacillus sp. JNUCC-31]UPK43517.1 ATP synthase subunit I [Paenibacillus pabuli]SEO64801.1 ATP synthase protein I [Paenibacillus sp. OK076]
MSELTRYRRWMTVFIMYFLMICFLAAAFLPRVETIALGLALGTVISWINASYLGRKVRRMLDGAAEGNLKRVNLGFLTRAALAVLAIFMAMQYPQYFNLYAVVAGLVIAQFSLLFIGILLSRKADS